MDVEKFFRMSEGVDNTSYAQNSSLQKKASDMVKHATLEALREAYLHLSPKSFGIADLGCSSGPNTLTIVKDMIEAVEEEASRKATHPVTEFRVYLNDLPFNDFNSIFRKFPDFYREYEGARKGGAVGRPHLYMSACPGSFYRKLFPDESLHFVHSSYSLHWLSRVPVGLYDQEGRSINNGNIYISATSPPKVAEAYAGQFQDDFSAFLRFRSQELKSGGKMVLIFLGRKGPAHVDRGNSLWGILSRSISVLVFKGKAEQEKLDSYEVPFYAPYKDEIEREIAREGSFELAEFEMFELEGEEGIVGGKSYGTTVANTVRAIQAPMIMDHFGDGIIDDLFMEYARLVDEESAVEEIRPVSFHLVLTRL